MSNIPLYVLLYDKTNILSIGTSRGIFRGIEIGKGGAAMGLSLID